MTTETVDFSAKIDREIAGGIRLSGQPGGSQLPAPKDFSELMEFAKLMAVSGSCIRKEFRGNPGMCLAILTQALKWNADPFEVARKAYVVNDQIAYEGQLVHAIVNTHAPLVGRLKGAYTGNIEDKSRACLVTGLLKGESEPSPYQSPPVSKLKKHSPLWDADPDQQLWYFAVRSWARRYVPEILMGIYTPEELRGEIIDITPISSVMPDSPPRPQPEDFAESGPTPPSPTEEEPDEPYGFELVDMEGNATIYDDPAEAYTELGEILADAAHASQGALEGVWESNQDAVKALGELQPADLNLSNGHTVAEALQSLYDDLRTPEPPEPPPPPPPSPEPPRRRGRPPRSTQSTQSTEPPAHITDVPDADGVVGTPHLAADSEEPPPGAPTPASMRATKQTKAAPTVEDEDSDVVFPKRDLSTPTYYTRAMAFVRKMRTDHKPPHKFTRFREVNAADLITIVNDMGHWAQNLDNLIKAGEAGQ